MGDLAKPFYLTIGETQNRFEETERLGKPDSFVWT